MTIFSLGRRRLSLSLRIEQIGEPTPDLTERAYFARELRSSLERERRSQELRHLTRPRAIL